MIRRILAALIAVVVIALLVQDIPLASYLRETEEARLTTALERDAFVLAGRSSDALDGDSDDAASLAAVRNLARQYAADSGARLVIVDADGVAVATSDEGDAAVGESYGSRPEFRTALGGSPTSGERSSQTLGGELLFAAVPVISGDTTVGAVRVSYDDRQVTEATSSKIWSLAVVGITTLLLAGVIGFILSRSITRRLRLLRHATERFARGDRAVRADAESGAPEVRSLAGSFNTMAARIDDLIAQQRAFAGDASHQLRSPLTAVRLRLEHARELVGVDPEGATQRLDVAEAELDRLDELIEGLLVLSRAEDAAAVETVDAGAIARERVEAWQALAEERESVIELDGAADPLLVSAVPTAVDQVLDNLIDNALRAGGPGTRIRVSLAAAPDDADAVDLHVIDNGPGMTAEQRARAFDRFWRGRNDDLGSGLGLAIVARLVRASGGEATLHDAVGEDLGLDARVRWRRP
ncbi:sensor histidine kinase [Schumannella soli]|uniref:sensor histidine kinase n=1 Tax=Schumannella soli TaxID=2590779 RepID=UPI00210574F5|nr:HAMP domain-containing sensor histidine kinase [Schumannella soli]